MPMKKHSTLIYLVNKCQAKSSASNRVENVNDKVLTEMDFEPSEQSIKNILDFAGSYEVLDTESAGQVEMILN
jgi:hypothetical protein